MVDALNRKIHAMHVETISVFKKYLRKLIIESITKDEHYVQVNDKLQDFFFDKRYEGYHLVHGVFFIYTYKMYIPNAEILRRIIIDETNKIPYSIHLRYQKTIATIRKQYFWLGRKKHIDK